MNIQEFNEHQKEFFDMLIELTHEKSKEYNTTQERFDHFVEAAGFSLHNKKESIAWEFCVKHLQSVRDMIKSVEQGDTKGLTQDRLDEKFGDIIIYMTLIHAMLSDKIKTTKDGES